MASSSGGVPPGFRFHPTDEELLHFYLGKKISFHKFDVEVIREVDLNRVEPWELQEKCRIGFAPQDEWYFFSHKDKKYPTGSRTNRATSSGFWKATGRDKCIRDSSKKIGMRKTLVFYRGRAPHGHKTDWIMHEYRLEDGSDPSKPSSDDSWVVCRVFKKKNIFKANNNSLSTTAKAYERILSYVSIDPAIASPHRTYDSSYLTRTEQPQLLEFHHLNQALQSSQIPSSHYPIFQLPSLIPQTPAFDLSSSRIAPDQAPITAKLFVDNCDQGAQSLRCLQPCEPATGADACDRTSQVQLPTNNDWIVIDSMHTSHIGGDATPSEGDGYESTRVRTIYPSLRGEMDFMGYNTK